MLNPPFKFNCKFNILLLLLLIWSRVAGQQSQQTLWLYLPPPAQIAPSPLPHQRELPHPTGNNLGLSVLPRETDSERIIKIISVMAWIYTALQSQHIHTADATRVDTAAMG